MRLPSKRYITCTEIIPVRFLIFKGSENPDMKISCPATRVGLNVACVYKGVMVSEVTLRSNIRLGLYKFNVVVICI